MATPQRIHIVGTAGSGKTTLGREIAARLGIPHIELDSLFWKPNWQQSELEDFRDRVRKTLSTETWVVDGNYSRVRDIIWENVELVVWLDFSLCVCFRRVLFRTLRRITRKEELWNGNRETFAEAFLSKDSIVLYSYQAHRKLRQRYSDLFSQPQNAHIRVAHLKNSAELGEFLDSFTS